MLNLQMNLIIAMPSSAKPNVRHGSRLFDTGFLLAGEREVPWGDT